jgi:hypothetical protein
MAKRSIYGLTLACGIVAAMLAMSGESRGACRLWDCLFGAAPCAQTTYAPAYVPAPVYAAPACQPTCSPCATPCAPQTCNYVAYRPYYAPAVVTAYQPAVGVYPLTTYRPFLGTYQTRLVPYTTYYQSYYAPAVSYGYSPAPSCGSCGGCNSCAPCASGGCGVTYEAPASGCSSGCSSCNVASNVQSVPAAESSASPPSTFEKANKPATKAEPATNENLQPIPEPETRPSSMSPALPDPNDRTASRATSSSVRVQLVGRPVQPAPEVEDSGWHPAKD